MSQQSPENIANGGMTEEEREAFKAWMEEASRAHYNSLSPAQQERIQELQQILRDLDGFKTKRGKGEELMAGLEVFMAANRPSPPKPGLVPVWAGLRFVGWIDPDDADPGDDLAYSLLPIKYDASGRLLQG